MTQSEKLDAAIKWLDTRWVLHPQNRVPKLEEALSDVFKWTPKVLKVKRSEKVNKNKVCTCPAQVELDDLKQRLLPQFAGRAERAERDRDAAQAVAAASLAKKKVKP